MARNIKILLAYDGTAYRGWERQKGFPTVQEKVEEAIRSLTGDAVNVIASGRTDAGVHALGQVANFRTHTRLDCSTVLRGLNALLPDDVRLLEAEDVAESFHATHAARWKLYRYCLHDGPVPDPFLRRYAWHVNWPLSDAAMQQAAGSLLGTHDFSSFETAGAPRETSVRTIKHIEVFRSGPEHIWSRQACGVRHAGAPNLRSQAGSLEAVPQSAPTPPSGRADPLLFLEVAADGFLYNMVRAITGTLVNVGRGFWPADAVPEILEARDRTRGGPTAPPHGLFLVRVEY